MCLLSLRDALEGGEPPPPLPLQGAQPTPSHCPPNGRCPASLAFVTGSNRPQPRWQHPPTAYVTASGAASEAPSLLMHPWPEPLALCHQFPCHY